jgi:DNA-directed RNA polymerase subunit H (RpoH/RPB5)
MVNTNSSVLISDIYKSRKIVLELMDNQGYDTNGYSKFSMSEVNSMKQNNQLDMLLETKSDASERKKIYISFYLAKTIRPSNLNEIIEDLFVLSETLKKSDTLYIIIKDDTNETLINELKHIWEKDGIFIIIESIKRLQFNILKHVLVPTHKIMNKDQIKEVMVRYNIADLNLLPDISRFDPVSRAIGLRPGDVCHIIRPSKTSIETNYYRHCI